MKRKIVLFVLLFALLFCGFAVSVFAEESALDQSNIETTESSEGVESEVNTFVGRIWEFIEKNNNIILDIAAYALIFIVGLLNKRQSSKITVNALKSLANTSSVTKSQTAVVESANNLIDAYNRQEEAFTKHLEEEQARDRMVATVMVCATTTLEMLRTVYPQSKNLPQGIKDLINLQYANCLKAIGDNSALDEIFKEVRTAISTVGENEYVD